ncbi:MULTISPECIES: hypothetical protein [Sphingobium]|uniref:hypothetical protein n=1 Tax=Sphingobium TaxID=165695 RepID=UPI002432C6DF|nr:hypothetical protein [Sphingobium yanoikuyae]
MTPAHQLAEKLTEAQRRAVIETGESDLRPYREVNGHVRVPLFREGIFASEWAAGHIFFSLTPLGLAVRAHLLSKENER